MFKIFEEPRKVMHIFDVENTYQNNAFILVNCIKLEGNTLKGELYAISDGNNEDLDNYYAEVARLMELEEDICVGNTFKSEVFIRGDD